MKITIAWNNKTLVSSSNREPIRMREHEWGSEENEKFLSQLNKYWQEQH